MEKYKKYFLSALPYLLIFIMTLCGMCVVFYDGIYKGHDYKFHMSNIIEQYETILSGKNLSPISGIVSMGLGTGTRLFYSPLPHLTVTIIALFYRIFDGTIIDAYKTVLVLSVFISGIFAYRFAMHFTKNNKVASIISAGIFVLFPYRIFDAFTRMAFAEFYSIMFMPLFFMGLYDITHIEKEVKIIPFIEIVIGGSLLFLSHNITAFYTYIFAFIYLLFNIKGLVKSFKFKRFIPYCGIAIFLLIGISSISLFSQLELLSSNLYVVSDDLLMWTNYEKVITRTDEHFLYSAFLNIKSLAYYHKDYFTADSLKLGIILYIVGCICCIATDLLLNKFIKLKRFVTIPLGGIVLFLIVSISSASRKEIYLGALIFILVYLFINLFCKNEKDTSKDKLWFEPILYYSILMIVICFVLMKYEWPWKYLPAMFLKIQFPWRLWALIQLFASMLVGVLVRYLNFKRIGSFVFTICVGLLLVCNDQLVESRMTYEKQYDSTWVNEVDNTLLDSGIANGFNKEYIPIVFFQDTYYVTRYKDSKGVKVYGHLEVFKSEYSKSLYNYISKKMLFNFDKYEDYSYDPKIIEGKGSVKVIEAFSPNYEFELNVTSKDGALVQMPLIYYPGYKVTVIDNKTGQKETIKPEMVDGLVSFSLEKGNYTVTTDFVGSTLRQISVAYTIISVTATVGLLAYAIYFENKRKKEDEDKTC